MEEICGLDLDSRSLCFPMAFTKETCKKNKLSIMNLSLNQVIMIAYYSHFTGFGDSRQFQVQQTCLFVFNRCKLRLIKTLLFPNVVSWPLIANDTGLYLQFSVHRMYLYAQTSWAWKSARTITPSNNIPITRSTIDIVILLKDLNNLFTS